MELLLALAVAALVSGVIFQVLVGEEAISRRLARRWREGSVQRRTLELVRSELRRAESVQLAPPGGASAAACGLGGRTVVLHLAMGAAQAPVTYSTGRAPSGLWRGQVLMRCGPAFSLDGQASGGAAQNRVVIDGLPATGGFEAAEEGPGLPRLELAQEFAEAGGGATQRIGSAITVAAAVGASP